MGWSLVPNGFGLKKLVVWSFRVRGDTHSLVEHLQWNPKGAPASVGLRKQLSKIDTSV